MKMKTVSTVLLASLTLLCSCGNDRDDYEKAKQANTIQAYEKFLDKHSDSKFVEITKQKMDSLRYVVTVSKDNLEKYKEFIGKYPNSRFYSKVLERIKEKIFPVILRNTNNITLTVERVESARVRKQSDYHDISGSFYRYF